MDEGASHQGDPHSGLLHSLVTPGSQLLSFTFGLLVTIGIFLIVRHNHSGFSNSSYILIVSSPP